MLCSAVEKLKHAGANRMPFPAKLAFTATRAAWSASQYAQDLAERLKQMQQEDQNNNQQVRLCLEASRLVSNICLH